MLAMDTLVIDGRRTRKWAYTINNPSKEIIDEWRGGVFTVSARHHVAQLESGAAGTPHIQGFVNWKNPKTFSATKTLLRQAHLERARGTLDDNYKYCTKPDGRLDGPWQHGFPVPRVLPSGLHPWQTRATELVTAVPNDRTIFWLWEPEGGVGKSVLQHIWHRDFEAILVGYHARDAKCAIKLAWCIDGCVPPHPIVMLNLPRDVQSPALWPVLEGIKDGMFFSGKYKSSMVILPLTHVVVFANEPPLRSLLSADKLTVFRIDHADLSMAIAPSSDPEEPPFFQPAAGAHGSL